MSRPSIAGNTMKITMNFEADASNKLNLLPYTGNNGLYSSVVLASSCIPMIEEIAEELGVDPSYDDLHATVIYSKQPCFEPVERVMEEQSSEPIVAYCNGVTSWVGHNKKTYIVLSLVSEALVLKNAALHRMGAQHTFVPYSPHMTLSDNTAVDADMKRRFDYINKKLAVDPLRLVFEHHHIGDLD